MELTGEKVQKDRRLLLLVLGLKLLMALESNCFMTGMFNLKKINKLNI